MALLACFGLGQEKAAPQATVKSFPGPNFVLRDRDLRPQKGGAVLGPMEGDGNGGAQGTFALYGASSFIEVGSLSFTGDGRLLAVGLYPGRVDLWELQTRKKLYSLKAGAIAGMSPDGRLLATDGNGIELRDVETGKVQRQIPWPVTASRPRVQGAINRLLFNHTGSRLIVSSNAQDDSVYDVASGALIATLAHTSGGQLSPDGSLLVGGSKGHLVVWRTNDWSEIRDVAIGSDYVTKLAIYPAKDLAVVGGLKSARLIRLSTGEDVAMLADGYTAFAAFNRSGTLIFTSTGTFAVWDASGQEYCSQPLMAGGALMISPDDRWLAAEPRLGDPTVAIWDLKSALSACGVRNSDL